MTSAIKCLNLIFFKYLPFKDQSSQLGLIIHNILYSMLDHEDSLNQGLGFKTQKMRGMLVKQPDGF